MLSIVETIRKLVNVNPVDTHEQFRSHIRYISYADRKHKYYKTSVFTEPQNSPGEIRIFTMIKIPIIYPCGSLLSLLFRSLVHTLIWFVPNLQTNDIN